MTGRQTGIIHACVGQLMASAVVVGVGFAAGALPVGIFVTVAVPNLIVAALVFVAWRRA